MKRKERWWMYDRYDGAHPESPGIDDNTVSTSITNIFQAHWREPWLNYEMVDNVTKTHWWNSFMKQYLWNADLDALVKKEYEKKAHKRLRSSDEEDAAAHGESMVLKLAGKNGVCVRVTVRCDCAGEWRLGEKVFEFENVRVRKKGVVKGLGASASLFYTPSSEKGSQSYNTSIASHLEERVQAEVAERIEEAKVQMQAQMEAQFGTQLQEALKKEREEAAIESKRMMETMLQNLFSNCSGGPPFQFRREDDPDMSGGGLGHQTPVS
uniref:Uncharacterized protein n=1 Tax=Chenopodium quinoa TaxID=63459 RepID=A0A803MXL8_CHEQI